MTNETNQEREALLPCPFCGGGETTIEEKGYWTGMRSEITHVEVKHWCNPGKIEGAYLTIKGKTREAAIERWNTRHRPKVSLSGLIDNAIVLNGLYDGDMQDAAGYYSTLTKAILTKLKEKGVVFDVEE